MNQDYKTCFLQIGHLFYYFSHSIMHYSWYMCLQFSITTVSPLDVSVQHIGQLCLDQILLLPSNFLASMKFFKLLFWYAFWYLSNRFTQLYKLLDTNKVYLIWHLVGVRFNRWVDDLEIMRNHEFLHVFVHESANGEEVFWVIPIFAQLLKLHPISHEPLGVPLVAFDKLGKLFLVQPNFVICSFKNLLYCPLTSFCFFIYSINCCFSKAGSVTGFWG